MTTKIRDIDRGYKDLIKRAFGDKKHAIDVGILASEGSQPHESGAVTVLEVAQWLEFGTSKQPARSFLRAWFDENQDRAKALCAIMMREVIRGTYTKEVGLERLAQKFVGEIQARMSAGIPPPNAPSTIAKKGSSTPGIDTGQTRSSVTYRTR